MSEYQLIVSIVSHGQARLVQPLLADLARLRGKQCRVILTLNIPEQLPFDPDHCGVTVRVVQNGRRRGFAANHNAAFRLEASSHFCVLNPDIRLENDPFPVLLSLAGEEGIGVVAPQIRNPLGAVEDSARRFPTPAIILGKALGRPDPPVEAGGLATFYPDWIAGMFMLFRSSVFERVGGFDERYFLYYEDVDLCARLRLIGLKAAVSPRVFAVHDAQRVSHRDLRYMTRHLSSMARFFLSRPGRRARAERW
jgi:N-acetylglucosaminyl-diphospho-decaprenol L-rhamnosyltransferase